MTSPLPEGMCESLEGLARNAAYSNDPARNGGVVAEMVCLAARVRNELSPAARVRVAERLRVMLLNEGDDEWQAMRLACAYMRDMLS